MKLFEAFPLPWTCNSDMGDNSIEDSRGHVVMKDMAYYPYISLDAEEMQELVEIVNASQQPQQ